MGGDGDRAAAAVLGGGDGDCAGGGATVNCGHGKTPVTSYGNPG